ncbi:MAG: choline-phosphate cytidylyltransferase [Fusobacteriales bacterium]|nr:MAG: choline-phosphate cytidylyltransferase [Fusobacteriales bacterium]
MKKNAIIMAAGMSSRFVPISYEKPKSLIKINGETLIERQIKQLLEANITDITIVTGYKAEMFVYLKGKYLVDLIYNENYKFYNNTSTLMKVKDKIKNTFICSADNYFTENIFLDTWDRSSYSVIPFNKKSNEYYVTTDLKGKIENVVIGGKEGIIMMGAVYFDEKFSKKFMAILEKEYKKLSTKNQLWEQVYIRNIDNLEMYIKKFKENIVYEFDSIDDIRKFDVNFLSNSKILEKICKYFSCQENEISNFLAEDKTLEKIDFKFKYKNKTYLFSDIFKESEK